MESVAPHELDVRSKPPAATARDAFQLPSAAELAISAASFIGRVARARFRYWLLAIAVGEGLNASAGILLPYALSRIIAQVTSGRGPGVTDARTLVAPVAWFAGLCVAELVFRPPWLRRAAASAPRQRQHVARSLFQYLHRHSHRFLTENFAGALAHRIGETSHGVNQVLFSALTEFWPMSIVIVVANVLLTRTNAWLGLFSGVWSVGFAIASLHLARRTQPLSSAASSARSRTAGLIVDSVTNHASVRLFARLDHERDRLDGAYESEIQIVLRSNLAMERIRVFQFAASAVLKAGHGRAGRVALAARKNSCG